MLTDFLKRSRANRYPNQHRIKKRHWCLGSAVILVGSWITHTTTATIQDNSVDRLPGVFDEIVEPDPHALLQDELVVDQILHMPGIKAPAVVPTNPLREMRHTVRAGDTIGNIFQKLGLDRTLPYKISEHEMASTLVSLTIGRDLIFKSDSVGLRELHYAVNNLQRMVVSFEDNEIQSAEIIDLPFEVKRRKVSRDIDSSLYESALSAGLSNGTIMEMIRIFGWDIDFVQDIRAGDSFHLIYEDYMLNDKKLADGDIIAAEFTTQDQTYRAIRFEEDNGVVSFYNPQGESMLGTFLRTPVVVSRISSRFGNRKHPISRKWLKHKGVDYAASRGTPIRATADGRVTLAGRKGGYGKTVVLRHAGRFSTLYGHMNGFAKGIRSGVRVKQGDVIGYIGTTGYSTGPHLHYEFRVDGVHRNPLTYKTPKASSIKSENKPAFAKIVASLSSELDQLNRNYQIVQANITASNQAQL